MKYRHKSYSTHKWEIVTSNSLKTHSNKYRDYEEFNFFQNKELCQMIGYTKVKKFYKMIC